MWENAGTYANAEHGPDYRLGAHENGFADPRMVGPDQPGDNRDHHGGHEPCPGYRQRPRPQAKTHGHGSDDRPPKKFRFHARFTFVDLTLTKIAFYCTN
jgi:hypothetical protein